MSKNENMTTMLSLRSFRLATLSGHIVQFEANVEKDIPNAIVSDAMAAGCVPVDRSQVPFFEDLKRSKVEFNGDIRRSMLYMAMMAIADKNDTKDFDGSQVPKQNVVENRVGFTVGRREVVDIYQQYLSDKADGRKFVPDGNAVHAMRVVEAEDIRELRELAAEMGISEAGAKGISSRELRKLMLTKLTGVVHQE